MKKKNNKNETISPSSDSCLRRKEFQNFLNNPKTLDEDETLFPDNFNNIDQKWIESQQCFQQNVVNIKSEKLK